MNNTTKTKIIITLTLVYLIPNHFNFQYTSDGKKRAIRVAVQWFGYSMCWVFMCADMTDIYREHIEGEE